MSKTILITGTSSGFGKLMVKTLIENDHKVVATMRDVRERNKDNAKELAALGAVIVEMDVTNDESVNTAISNAISEVGNIDIVVNNAGVGTFGRQESFNTDDFQKVFDINVWGVQRIFRVIIPHFREKQSGSIINISSVLGRMVMPYFGPYNASKRALESIIDNYRIELSQFGIDVSLIEPGGFGTNFMANLLSPTDVQREEFYKGIEPSPEQFGEALGNALEQTPEQDPQNVADALLKLVETDAKERAYRTTVDILGMGSAVEPYNEAYEKMNNEVTKTFGVDHFLQLK